MKVEYKFITESDHDEFLAALNKSGDEGWRPVAIQPSPGGNSYAYLVRDKQDRAEQDPKPAPKPAEGGDGTGDKSGAPNPGN